MDRKNTRSWQGDTSIANVDEVDCWNRGRDWALQVLRESRAFKESELDIESIIQAEPGVDMLRPYCVQVGVRAGDRPIYNLVNLDGLNDDDREENENNV